jgi:hypothetical protein
MPAPTHAGEVVQQRGRPAQAIRAFHTLLGDNDMLVSLALFPPIRASEQRPPRVPSLIEKKQQAAL